MTATWVAPAVTIGGALFGGSKASKAAKSQARAQNEAAHRQWEYDKDLWGMSKEKMIRDDEYLRESIKSKEANFRMQAALQDQTRMDKWNYDVQIRNYQQETAEKEFQKSEELTEARFAMASMSGQSARENAATKWRELQTSVAFDAQDQHLQSIESELSLASTSGRSMRKIKQSSIMKRAFSTAKLSETLQSGSQDYVQQLKDIALDETSEKLSAWAQKMLKPGVLPTPPKPIPTPIPSFDYPPPLEDFDFGPEPVLGATASVSAAGSQAFWGTAGSSMFKGAGDFIGALDK